MQIAAAKAKFKRRELTYMIGSVLFDFESLLREAEHTAVRFGRSYCSMYVIGQLSMIRAFELLEKVRCAEAVVEEGSWLLLFP